MRPLDASQRLALYLRCMGVVVVTAVVLLVAGCDDISGSSDPDSTPASGTPTSGENSTTTGNITALCDSIDGLSDAVSSASSIDGVSDARVYLETVADAGGNVLDELRSFDSPEVHALSDDLETFRDTVSTLDEQPSPADAVRQLATDGRAMVDSFRDLLSTLRCP